MLKQSKYYWLWTSWLRRCRRSWQTLDRQTTFIGLLMVLWCCAATFACASDYNITRPLSSSSVHVPAVEELKQSGISGRFAWTLWRVKMTWTGSPWPLRPPLSQKQKGCKQQAVCQVMHLKCTETLDKNRWHSIGPNSAVPFAKRQELRAQQYLGMTTAESCADPQSIGEAGESEATKTLNKNSKCGAAPHLHKILQSDLDNSPDSL